MRQQTRWKLFEVLRAIGLADRIWRCMNHASWCERHHLPPEKGQEWHYQAVEAIEELRKMGLGELVDAIIKMK